MVGATRSRLREAESNDPAFGHGEDTLSSDARHRSAHRSLSVSRLSEDLGPMHIGDDNALPQPLPLDTLGQHVKDILYTVYQLEGLGLQTLRIPLPKIIMLGAQSTGKSSVIESISGIKTPRATGTCTRCPLFIRLESPSDPGAKWTAHITIRRSFGYDGKKPRGSKQRFPGWVQLPEPTTIDFMSSSDPDALEHMIKRAQLAATSPLVDYQEFTKGEMPDLNGVHTCTFSPNVVCITISQPGLAALSFYDLPGIIGQSERPEDVKFVRDLVMDYVRDPEALILVTCAMSDDMANSSAGGIARELKATDRCIGVLTKPDRVLANVCHRVLRDVYEENHLPLGHGYFVVRNLGDEQLDEQLSHYDARTQERNFFANNEPFATAFHQHEARFGTWNLQAYLSLRLAEQVIKKLPIIQNEIDTRLHEVEATLKQYPEPSAQNASRTVFNIVLSFTQNVSREMEGDFPNQAWRNDWKELKKALFSSLATLKPTLTVRGSRDIGIYRASLSGGSSVRDSIVLDSDEDDAMGDDNHVASRTPETPSRKRRTETDASPGPSPLKKPCKETEPRKPLPQIVFKDFKEKKTKFQLDDIAHYLEKTSNTSMPGQVEHKATNQMTLKTLKNWQLPLDEFFEKLEHLLKVRLQILFDKHFGTRASTPLYERSWKIVVQMVDLNLQQQRTTMAAESLADENHGVYIFHTGAYTRDREAQLEYYREARYKTRLSLYKEERSDKTGKHMTPVELAKLLKNEKFAELMKHDPYDVELGVATNITTYYMMAARRFHDAICMRVESKFFEQLRTQLRDELESRLEIHDEAEGHRNAVRLLTEDPDREARRQALLVQMTSLLRGQQVLDELKNKKYGDTSGNGGESLGLPSPSSDEMDEA